MYTMKDVCRQLDISYETLKFYCREGLIPHVQRDKNNYRLFDDHHIAWIKGLQCLRKCGMHIKDMKQYMEYCLEGEPTIALRQDMLNALTQELERRQKDIQESLDYIIQKQAYYDNVLSGDTEYSSHLAQMKKK